MQQPSSHIFQALVAHDKFKHFPTRPKMDESDKTTGCDNVSKFNWISSIEQKNLAGAWYNSSLNALIDKLKLNTEKWTDWKRNRSVLLISRQTTVLSYKNINFPNVWSIPIFSVRIVLLCLDITIDARIVQHDALKIFIKIKMISFFVALKTIFLNYLNLRNL